jgi:hypothetical protein
MPLSIKTYISFFALIIFNTAIFAVPSSITSTNMTVNNGGLVFQNSQLGIGTSDPVSDISLDINGNSSYKFVCYEPKTQLITDTGGLSADWSLSNHYSVTVNSTLTGVLEFIDAPKPCSLILFITYTVAAPNFSIDPDIIWVGNNTISLTKTNGAVDIIGMFFDGTNYYGAANLDFR